MKARKVEERLALIGALIVLIGVSSAAEDALAEETATVLTSAVAIHTAAAATIESAAKANADAALRAAESLARNNWINLEIQLEDRSSTLIAGEK